MADISNEKKRLNYECKLCYFTTCKKTDYTRHLQTKKHIDLQTTDTDLHKNEKNETAPTMVCFCGKAFKHRQSLYKHKKACVAVTSIVNVQYKNEIETDLIKYLLKENAEFKQLIIDQSSKMMDLAVKPSTVNNTIQSTNCNNKQQFNLNVFLNEKCKDAMNMSDFIDSIKVNDEDFENIGKLGYVQGISNIFIKNLQKLDECLRPMHCSDAKREVIYIKENNEWKKDENQKAVRHVIAMIAHKNFKYMPFWTDANPGVFDGSTKKNDLFLKITNQITTAITPDDDIGICKIIRNVANRVVIDKSGGLS